MLITPTDIADALERLVAEKFPGEKIYRELTPSDFSRPSNLIVQDSVRGNVDYGCGIVKMQATFTITTFVEVDAYHHSHLSVMHNRQMILTGIVLPGYIKVKSRAPKVESVELAGNYDYDTVTVVISYTLDRNDFQNLPQYPLMEEFHLNEEVKH